MQGGQLESATTGGTSPPTGVGRQQLGDRVATGRLQALPAELTVSGGQRVIRHCPQQLLVGGKTIHGHADTLHVGGIDDDAAFVPPYHVPEASDVAHDHGYSVGERIVELEGRDVPVEAAQGVGQDRYVNAGVELRRHGGFVPAE